MKMIKIALRLPDNPCCFQLATRPAKGFVDGENAFFVQIVTNHHNAVRMKLSCPGDFEDEKMRKRITKRFSKLPANVTGNEPSRITGSF